MFLSKYCLKKHVWKPTKLSKYGHYSGGQVWEDCTKRKVKLKTFIGVNHLKDKIMPHTSLFEGELPVWLSWRLGNILSGKPWYHVAKSVWQFSQRTTNSSPSKKEKEKVQENYKYN